MNAMTREELGRALMQACLIRGEFQLRSGVLAKEYFDKYRFESDPELLRATARDLAGLVPREAEALAGLELGGVPIATAVSQLTGLPALFVRKRAKEYGTRRLVEGGEVRGKRIVVIEDVVTSGGQLLQSSIQLRDLGAIIVSVICVVDREAGGRESLAAAGFELKSLYTFAELQRLAVS
jgi:orotate phosphoribosyltransferase